jgi:hypothetical protein
MLRRQAGTSASMQLSLGSITAGMVKQPGATKNLSALSQ